MLGHPVTPVPGRLDGLRDGGGADQRVGSFLAVLDADEVEHGQRERILFGTHHAGQAPAGRLLFPEETVMVRSFRPRGGGPARRSRRAAAPTARAASRPRSTGTARTGCPAGTGSSTCIRAG